MVPAFLEDALARFPGEPAVARGRLCATYDSLRLARERWTARLQQAGVSAGHVTSLEGEYDVETVGALLACVDAGCLLVPLSTDSWAQAPTFLEIGEVEYRVRVEGRTVERTGRDATHPLYLELRHRESAGLVLFSSGSTGRHKGAVHDLHRLLEKFAVARHRYRTLVFLQLDHIGGVNTLFYTLSNGGTVVVPTERSPAAVAEAIERHQVQLLPTSPTFLNLLLLSGEHERRDLSSLELITYGTETMPASTLERVAAAFPKARLQQTYGLTEVGILRSKSRDDRSLWVRVGGEGYQTKVVDGRLWVKAESAMLGYLNAPSPFDAEGYFETGDRVEVDGEWLRILGRDTEIINVGGSKVYPAEVESVLLQLDNVEDAVVHGEPHPITGQIVVAHVRLVHGEPASAFKTRMRQFCRERLPAFQVPARVVLANEPLHSSRFKRMRSQLSG